MHLFHIMTHSKVITTTFTSQCHIFSTVYCVMQVQYRK